MHETKKVLSMILVAHDQSAKVLKPSKQPLYLPSPLVAAQPPAILCRLFLPVVSMRRNHLYPTLCPLLIPRVALVCAILDQSLRLLICKALIYFQAEDGIRDKLVTGVQTCA